MAYKKWSLTALAIVLSAIGVSFLVVAFGKADMTNNIDWFSVSPIFQAGAEYSTTPVLGNNDCQQTNVPVNRGLITNPYESYCMVPTAMGLMDSQGRVVVPEGYTTGYPIEYISGGHPVVLPNRNQASALNLRGYSNGPGVTLGLFKQLSNHMKLKIGFDGIKYVIENQDQDPDLAYRYTGGEFMRFNYDTAAYSDNGRAMIIDTIWSGFMKVDFMDLSVKPFASSLPRNSSDGLLPASTALDNDGRIAAIAYNAPGGWGDTYFKIIDVSSCLNTLPSSSSVVQNFDSCKSVDVLPKLKQSLPNILSVERVRFVSDRTIAFVARYRDSGGALKSRSYSVTAGGQPMSLKQYMALGDSYISGEGALSYREGTDTTRNKCHQSLVSYPYLLSAKFQSSASVACSGARIKNIEMSRSTKAIDQLIGERPTDNEKNIAMQTDAPGVVAQQELVTKNNPEAITISIVGNDIGFGQILEKCVHPLKHFKDLAETEATCYDNYEDRAEVVDTINAQFPKLRALYESLKQNGMDGRRLYVIGYPQVAKVDGDCGLNVQMNADEVRFAHDLIEYLDSVIKQAADQAGVQYVDTQTAFDGHRLCEGLPGQMAVNGFTITKGPDGQYDFKASFHPNQLGHELLAQTIAAQTNNLTKAMPVATTRTDTVASGDTIAMLRNMPRTNRPLRYVRVVDDGLKVIQPQNSPLKFVIAAKDFLTKPNTVYNLVINSVPRDLGTFSSDDTGDIAVNAALPADLPQGFHTVHLYGSDMFGDPIDMQQVIFVTAGGNDSDGDGLPDMADSCVLASQSGSDADHDGIDDVCDPQIGLPPTGPNDPTGPGEPQGIVWSDNAIMPISIQATAGP